MPIQPEPPLLDTVRLVPSREQRTKVFNELQARSLLGSDRSELKTPTLLVDAEGDLKHPLFPPLSTASAGAEGYVATCVTCQVTFYDPAHMTSVSSHDGVLELLTPNST